MELHLYPGQKLLLAIDNKVVKGRFEAWGGPSKMGSDIRMAEEPTWPGEYIINTAHAYRTNTWLLSRIKWGVILKDMPAKNDVWYKLPSGKWASISKDHNISRNDILKLNFDLYGVRKIPKSWVFNDFGPIAIRWYKDLNNNKVLDGKERLSGQMFHTTQQNEAEHATGKPLAMTHSHGCVHLKPAERDKLFAIGAFKPGTRFIVYKYNEIYRP